MFASDVAEYLTCGSQKTTCFSSTAAGKATTLWGFHIDGELRDFKVHHPREIYFIEAFTEERWPLTQSDA